jgi:hypothetical protein
MIAGSEQESPKHLSGKALSARRSSSGVAILAAK